MQSCSYHISPRDSPGNSWWGCAARFSKSWPYFRPKNIIFHTLPFSDLEVITKRNITCLHKTEIMSSLVRLKLQQKKAISNFMLHFLSYSFELKRRTRWYTTVVPLLTVPDSRPKWAKSIPVSRQKRRKNPTL